MAIQQNSSDLNGMKSDTSASLFHIASSPINDYHTHCPLGSDSWCYSKPIKQIILASISKPEHGLPLDIIKVVKHIYQ